MAEKRRAMRLAHALRADARRGGPSAPALRRAADAIALDHAFYTEAQLRRRPIVGGRPTTTASIEGSAPDIPLPYSSCLRDLVSAGLEPLAIRLGLTGRQAGAWVLHVRGDSLRTIAASLGISYTSAYALLARAHRRVCASWLAAYRESLRRDAPPQRPR